MAFQVEAIADYPDHLRNWNEIPETSQLADGQEVRQMIGAVSPKNKSGWSGGPGS